MMMEGMDRMKEEKFRSRCPTGRLQSWYDKKCLDETQVEKATLEHQNEEHLCGVLSIAEGQHVCIQIAKHEVVFGILAHNVTETMLHGTCIISDTAVGSVKYKTYAYLTLLSGVARLRLNVHKVRTPTAELETKLALENLDPLAMAMKIANATQMYTTGPGNKDKKGLSVDATHNTLPRTDIALSKDTRVCLILSPFKVVFGVVVHIEAKDSNGTCMIADEFEESVWYQTSSLKTLHEAVRRLDEHAYRTMCPTSKLRRLLMLGRADASIMATKYREQCKATRRNWRKSCP
jgi:hypothetical protein